MKTARALFALVTLTGFSTAATTSCGSDEATGNSGGAGGGILGSGGNAGIGGGRAGSAGSGGGDGGTVIATRLGQACVTTTECDPDGTTGLTCVEADTTALGGGGPPRGLCTLACSSHDTCWEVDGNSLCVDFGNAGYCVEGCELGPPDPLNPPKCHNRSQFACTPLDAIESGDPCVDFTDCPANAPTCLNNVCAVIISACLPACTGSQDCPNGTFCDREFGTCLPEDPGGDPLGSECTPTMDEAADTCDGFCQRVADVPNLDGLCAEICAFGSLCSWENEVPGGVCLFSTALNDNPSAGDFGFCTQFCDCNSDCRTPGFGCVPVPTIQSTFDRAGLCLYPFGEDGGMVETIACAGGGTGGAGGAGPDGDAGAGGN